MMNRLYTAFAILAIALFSFVPAAQAADAPGDAKIIVVHGIPGEDLSADPALPVDVAVNGGVVLPGFTFGQVEGPLPLAPGMYQIEISLADPQNPGSNPAVIDVMVPLAMNERAAIIAHLDENGDLTASKFELDASPTPFNQSRVHIQHTAWAPTVDIDLERFFLGDTIALSAVENGDQAIAEVRPGVWGAEVSPAGGSPIFGPEYGLLKPSRSYMIFAVGSLTNNTFQLLTVPLKR